MKRRYWAQWVIASWVLFVTLPSPWYRIGLGMFLVAISWAAIELIIIEDRATSNEKKLERSMYQALDNSEKISDSWFTTGFDIPHSVVQEVLRKWESSRLIVRCDPPADASDTNGGNWYHITIAGQVTLGKQYENPAKDEPRK